MTSSTRRLAALMFTDIVGFTALAQADEANALSLLEEHNQLLRQSIAKFRGREVKTVGDAFLVEFESALDATRSALEIQERLGERNESVPEGRRIKVRIGLHVGDVVQSDGDVLGDAVNIASRIEPLAEPDGICLSQQVYDQVQNKIPNAMVRLPSVSLKNVKVPIAVYRILPTGGSERTVGPTLLRPVGRSVAVLPLANISPDPNDAYFADGLTEELISTLSQLPGLSVIARTSVAQYKSSPKPVVQVGQELGVDTVLEGSVRKAGNRIRISLQLIDAPSQRHLWANTFNREVGDVFSVQTEIADRTVESLRPTLAAEGGTETKRKLPVNTAAYDAYLRALVASSAERTPSAVEEAIHFFEEATRLDPTFAEAFAAWANFYVSIAGDSRSLREVMPPARKLAARALELDPESSMAHLAIANIALQFDLDWERAEREFGQALALNPNNATALSFLSLLFIALERFDEAKDVLRRAIRIDPRGNHRRTLSWVELESGDFDAAIRLGLEEQGRHPESVAAHVYLGFFYLAAGRREDAIRQADFPVEGADPVVRFDHALLNALVGRPDEAREVLAEDGRGEYPAYNAATDIASLYAALGDREKALDLLEKDSRDGDQTLWLVYRGVFFDSVRDDPRFVALLRRFRLPTHPISRPSRGQ